MFYATHWLHIPQRAPLKLYVVEVRNGVVVSFFPFDGERQSMVWVDELFLSHSAQARFLSEIKNEVAQAAQPLYLYSLGSGNDGLVPIR